MQIRSKEIVNKFIAFYDKKEFLKLEQSKKIIRKQGDLITYYVIGISGKPKQVELVRYLEKTSTRDLMVRFIDINKDKFDDIKEISVYTKDEDDRSLYIDLKTKDDEKFNLEVTYYTNTKLGYKDIYNSEKAKNRTFSIFKMRDDMVYYDVSKDIVEIEECAKKEFISIKEFTVLIGKRCVEEIYSSPTEEGDCLKGVVKVIDEDLNQREYVMYVK